MALHSVAQRRQVAAQRAMSSPSSRSQEAAAASAHLCAQPGGLMGEVRASQHQVAGRVADRRSVHQQSQMQQVGVRASRCAQAEMLSTHT